VFSSQLLERSGLGRRHTQGCSKKFPNSAAICARYPRRTRNDFGSRVISPISPRSEHGLNYANYVRIAITPCTVHNCFANKIGVDWS
jgi:hypothetical protein